MDELIFGPAGIPKSTDKRSSENGVHRCRELGFGAMELEFVHGVRMGENTAVKINDARGEESLVLTAHGPYYINLNADEKEKRAKSRERIIKTARVGSWCGAYSITFHAGYYLDQDPEEVYDVIKEQMQQVVEEVKDEDIDIWIRPETTGSPTQFGTLKEIIKLSNEMDMVMPCIDFAHLHARNNGGWNTYEEFCQILDELEEGLGREALENLHCHVSGIEYGEKGEKNHLLLDESDFNYKDLMKALKEYECKGVIICESPSLEEDAAILKKAYEEA